jgi:hypothetical protein
MGGAIDFSALRDTATTKTVEMQIECLLLLAGGPIVRDETQPAKRAAPASARTNGVDVPGRSRGPSGEDALDGLHAVEPGGSGGFAYSMPSRLHGACSRPLPCTLSPPSTTEGMEEAGSDWAATQATLWGFGAGGAAQAGTRRTYPASLSSSLATGQRSGKGGKRSPVRAPVRVGGFGGGGGATSGGGGADGASGLDAEVDLRDAMSPDEFEADGESCEDVLLTGAHDEAALLFDGDRRQLSPSTRSVSTPCVRSCAFHDLDRHPSATASQATLAPAASGAAAAAAEVALGGASAGVGAGAAMMPDSAHVSATVPAAAAGAAGAGAGAGAAAAAAAAALSVSRGAGAEVAATRVAATLPLNPEFDFEEDVFEIE